MFGTFYNTNGRDITSLEQLDTSLLKLGDKINCHDVLLAGDFNIPNVNWSNNSVSIYPSCMQTARKLLQITDDHNLKQIVRKPTRRQGNAENILDLIMTNNADIMNNIQVLPGISDHDIVLVDLMLKPKRKKNAEEKSLPP